MQTIDTFGHLKLTIVNIKNHFTFFWQACVHWLYRMFNLLFCINIFVDYQLWSHWWSNSLTKQMKGLGTYFKLFRILYTYQHCNKLFVVRGMKHTFMAAIITLNVVKPLNFSDFQHIILIVSSIVNDPAWELGGTDSNRDMYERLNIEHDWQMFYIHSWVVFCPSLHLSL